MDSPDFVGKFEGNFEGNFDGKFAGKVEGNKISVASVCRSGKNQ